jgi:hypothetical protein
MQANIRFSLPVASGNVAEILGADFVYLFPQNFVSYGPTMAAELSLPVTSGNVAEL